MLKALSSGVFWIGATMAITALDAMPAAEDEVQDGDWVQLTGTVTRIEDESLTLDVGEQDFEVDTSALAYDRADASSPRPIEAGDRVIVFGRMDDADLLGDRQIEASTITKLPDESDM